MVRVRLEGVQRVLRIVGNPPNVLWGCDSDIVCKSTIRVSSVSPGLLPAVMQNPSHTPKLPSSASLQMSPLHRFLQLRRGSCKLRPLDQEDNPEWPFSLVDVLPYPLWGWLWVTSWLDPNLIQVPRAFCPNSYVHIVHCLDSAYKWKYHVFLPRPRLKSPPKHSLLALIQPLLRGLRRECPQAPTPVEGIFLSSFQGSWTNW